MARTNSKYRLNFFFPFLVLCSFFLLSSCGSGSSEDIEEAITQVVDSNTNDDSNNADESDDSEDDNSDDDSTDTNDDSDSGDDQTEDDDGTINLGGIVVAKADDADSVASLYHKSLQWLGQFSFLSEAIADLDTGSSENTALADATVTLFKLFANGTEEQVDIGEVITDENGEFEIENIPEAPEGSGAETDFYYEIRITKGDITLVAPAAPQEDTDVNVSPESDLAASILSDVVAVPGEDEPPLPSADNVEAMRELVVQDAGSLVDEGSIEIPSATAGEDIAESMANGLSAAGGNSEDMFKALSFESEYLALSNNDEATSEDVAGYIKRLVEEACRQKEGNYIPQDIAEGLGEFFISEENLVTFEDLISAYNDHNGNSQDMDESEALTQMQELIEETQEALSVSASSAEELGDDQRLAFYGRLQEYTEFELETELEIDQAYLILQLFNRHDDSEEVAYCEIGSELDLNGLIADLTDLSSLAEPSISAYEIYHNSGFGCNEGDGEGHFVAEIRVYSASKEISDVTISSSDSSALDGTGNATLNSEGDRYTSNEEGYCVALGTEVTYTVTANFTDSSSATTTIDRNHPRVPEASSEVLVDEVFISGSDQASDPTVVDTRRPLYQWTSPEEMLDAIIDDSANADIQTSLSEDTLAVKYTYEFAHVNLNQEPVSPINSQDYPSCAMVNSGALYAVDSFLPTEDCAVEACAEELGESPENIACRMNIQSYLVDQFDNLLGQAAGHFRFFCVDTDDDGECG